MRMFRTVCLAMMPAVGRSFTTLVSVRAFVINSFPALSATLDEEEQELRKRSVEAWMQLQKKGKELEEKPAEVSSRIGNFESTGCLGLSHLTA